MNAGPAASDQRAVTWSEPGTGLLLVNFPRHLTSSQTLLGDRAFMLIGYQQDLHGYLYVLCRHIAYTHLLRSGTGGSLCRVAPGS